MHMSYIELSKRRQALRIEAKVVQYNVYNKIYTAL